MRALLSYSVAGLAFCAILLARFVRWVWRDDHLVIAWLFRALAVLSVGYLIFDRIYEIGATVSSPGSDPTKPFAYPFLITNNSHVFTLRNIRWTCHILDIKYDNPNYRVQEASVVRTGSTNTLGPSDSIAIPCSNPVAIPAKILTTDVRICVSYEAQILGRLWPSHPNPNPTRFTWAGWASNPQWIRGQVPEGPDARIFTCEDSIAPPQLGR